MDDHLRHCFRGRSIYLSSFRILDTVLLIRSPLARCGDVKLLAKHALQAITMYSFTYYILIVPHSHLCSLWTAPPILPCLTGGTAVYLAEWQFYRIPYSTFKIIRPHLISNALKSSSRNSLRFSRPGYLHSHCCACSPNWPEAVGHTEA